MRTISKEFSDHPVSVAPNIYKTNESVHSSIDQLKDACRTYLPPESGRVIESIGLSKCYRS